MKVLLCANDHEKITVGGPDVWMRRLANYLALNNIEISKNLIETSKNKIKLGKNVKIYFVKDRPGHDIRYALNSNKIKKKLSWKPKTSFSEGIKLTLNWYFENKSYYKSLSKKDILNRLGKA